MLVYVLNADGYPLIPSSRCAHIRHLLKAGRAKVVRQKPFPETNSPLRNKEQNRASPTCPNAVDISTTVHCTAMQSVAAVYILM